MNTCPSIRLSTVEIPVENLDRAASWYRRVLDMNQTWSDDGHALLEPSQKAGKFLDLGVKVLLVLTAAAERLAIRNSRTGVVHGVLDVETDDLAGLHALLRSRGVALDPLGEPVNEWAPRGFPFQDSEGNVFGVYAYTGAP